MRIRGHCWFLAFWSSGQRCYQRYRSTGIKRSRCCVWRWRGTGVAAVDCCWRFAVTNWQGWWLAVPLLFAEVLGAVHTLGFQATIWPWPAPVLESGEDTTQLAIFIMVPTVNEGVSTLRPTLEGCIVARQKYLAQYPEEQVTIVVCTTVALPIFPRWTEIETLAQELDVRCITRSIGGGAKAGNIENARQYLCEIKSNSSSGHFRCGPGAGTPTSCSRPYRPAPIRRWAGFRLASIMRT